MEVVLEWSRRYPDTQIICIINDRYFIGMATREHIHDFLLCSCEETQFRTSVRQAIPKCIHSHE